MSVELKQKLSDELKQAMKSREKIKTSVIRMVLSAVHNAEIAKQSELENGDVLGIIAKEIKQRHESIDAFKKGGRQDLVDQEEAELAILLEYQPKQLTRDEIIVDARRIIEEVGAQELRDKGKVMPKLTALLKGRADGREINEVVTELLGS